MAYQRVEPMGFWPASFRRTFPRRLIRFDAAGGTKATALGSFCAGAKQGFVRFDYSVTEVPGGDFEAGSIGRWNDALAVIDSLTEGEQILVRIEHGRMDRMLLLALRSDRSG